MPRSSRGSHSHGSYGHKCTCGGDFESVSDDARSPSPSHRPLPNRRNRDLVCKECGRRRNLRTCSRFLIIFSILIAILIFLGAGLAFVGLYTSTLGYSNVEDLRTYEYQYQLKRLMHAIAIGGILAAISGVFGLVAINPKVGNNALKVIFEIMLLLTAALLLILGALSLGAILIRRKVVDEHFRPIMTAYQHEDPANPFINLHRFQAEFRCCGLSKPPNPYKHLQQTSKGPLPWSCCASFTSDVLKDPAKVQNIVDNVKNRNCTHDVAGTHTTFCDQINPGLADWAFGSGIEALGVSLYCIILLVISCIARQVNVSSHAENEYEQ